MDVTYTVYENAFDSNKMQNQTKSVTLLHLSFTIIRIQCRYRPWTSIVQYTQNAYNDLLLWFYALTFCAVGSKGRLANSNDCWPFPAESGWTAIKVLMLLDLLFVTASTGQQHSWYSLKRKRRRNGWLALKLNEQIVFFLQRKPVHL